MSERAWNYLLWVLTIALFALKGATGCAKRQMLSSQATISGVKVVDLAGRTVDPFELLETLQALVEPLERQARLQDGVPMALRHLALVRVRGRGQVDTVLDVENLGFLDIRRAGGRERILLALAPQAGEHLVRQLVHHVDLLAALAREVAIDKAVVERAVDQLAARGLQLPRDEVMDGDSGLWRHSAGLPIPALSFG